MHLRQPHFDHIACGPFTKNKGRIQKLKKTGNSRFIYRNKLDKACFRHDIAYGDFKDLAKRNATDKVLRDKTFNIAKNPKYDGYRRGFASMVQKILLKNFIILLLENHKPIIRTFYEKELQKANQQEFKIEKVIKRRGDMIIHLIAGLIKETLYKNESILS